MEIKEELISLDEISKKIGISYDGLVYYRRKGLIPYPEKMGKGKKGYPKETVDKILKVYTINKTNWIDMFAEHPAFIEPVYKSAAFREWWRLRKKTRKEENNAN